MPFDKICSLLVQEPYNLSIPEISQLNPYQVRHIFFRPDEDSYSSQGIPGLPSSNELTHQQLFWRVWKDWRGKTEEETQALWDEEQKKLQNP